MEKEPLLTLLEERRVKAYPFFSCCLDRFATELPQQPRLLPRQNLVTALVWRNHLMHHLSDPLPWALQPRVSRA